MKKRNQKQSRLWLRSLWNRSWFYGLAGLGLAAAFSFTEPFHWLQNHGVRTLQFQVRQMMGLAPKLDHRIKVFAYSDETVTRWGSKELGLWRWSKILEDIAATKPAAIYLDQFDTTEVDDAQIKRFTRSVQELGVSVVVGGQYLPSSLAYRAEVDRSDNRYKLERFLSPSGGYPNLKWIPERQGYFYGPKTKIREGFALLGHRSFDDMASFPGIIRQSEEYGVPAAPLMVGRGLQLRRNELWLGDQKVRKNLLGMTLVNYPSLDELQASTFEFFELISPSSEAGGTRRLAEGDVVVLLSQAYSGGESGVWSPLGKIPKGFADVAIINSVLTRNWAIPTAFQWIALTALGLMGCAAALVLRGGRFGLFAFSVFLGLPLTGLLSFALVGIELPWLGALFGFAFSLLFTIIPVSFQRAREKQRVLSAFEGFLPPSTLSDLVIDSSALPLGGESRQLSVMYVEVLSFALFAKDHSSQETIRQIREVIGELTEVVHRHGGIVDSVFGDGLQCVFGLNLDGKPYEGNHAEAVVRCAQEIQREQVRRNLIRAEVGGPAYLIRVGVNSCEIQMGNLGTESRIHLAMIGEGVNQAKWLESACDTYRIMIGGETLAQLPPELAEEFNLKERLVEIPHVEGLVKAYEHDPFENNKEEYRQSLKTHRAQINVERKAVRTPVGNKKSGFVLVKTQDGQGKMLDFSKTGFGISFDQYLGCGVILDLRLDTEDNMLAKNLRDRGIFDIACEVKWGREIKKGEFMLGLKIRGLSEPQRLELFEELSHFNENHLVAQEENASEEKQKESSDSDTKKAA